MSKIVITQADTGFIRMSVLRSERVTKNMVRVTFGGADLARFNYQGFDQWFRLAIAVADGGDFAQLPQRFGIGGYLRYLRLPKGTRPVIRNYTVRAFRAAALEMDVDFVAHGTDGVAGVWAARVQAGTEVAFLDQGCGWRPVTDSYSLLVADESGLPAVAGILRDMPRTATGHALIELFDPADQQEIPAPPGMTVEYVVRPSEAEPGSVVLPRLRELALPTEPGYAFAVGESALATGARRYLVRDTGWPKTHVTFAGYWRRGRAALS